MLLVEAASEARLETPPPAQLYTDRFGRFLALVGDGPGGELGFWPVEPVPERVALATVLLEDRRFWSHPGVDPVGVVRALWQNLASGRRVSGASTLAMQVARMQHPRPRTFWNKAREAVTAVLLTSRYGRTRILAHYLAWAPYGNRLRGMAAASRFYLGKPLATLSWAEIAYLAAIPKAPTTMNPYLPEGHRRAKARAEKLLLELFRRGALSLGELELARSELASVPCTRKPERPRATLHLAVAWQRAWAKSPPQAGKDPTRIVTTLDLELQQQLQDQVHAHLERADPMGKANGALMVVRLPEREVLAAVGSASFFDGSRSGAYDYTALPRPPGSTLKPFLYALALEEGLISPTSVLDDLQPYYGITNADGRFLGPLLPAQALACSRNVPAAMLLSRLTPRRFLSLLQDLGVLPENLPPQNPGLGLAVGGVPTTLRRLVAAYATLASDGNAAPLVWIEGAQVEGKRVLSPQNARLVTAFLADPMARLPAFPRLGPTEFPFPVAVKTGTSPGGRDGWTVAYSRSFVVGAWVGRADWQRQEQLTGYTSAALLVRETLLSLHPEDSAGLADWEFPPPEGFVPVTVCALTGLLPGPHCPHRLRAYVRPSQAPREVCTAHQVALVDHRTGFLATAKTPRRFVVEKAFLRLPPRYHRWLADQGLAPPLPNPGQPGNPPEPGSVLAPPLRVAILFPQNGLRIVGDPEAPAGTSTLELAASVFPPVPELLWLVDGKPFALAPFPYTVAWPLVPGRHRVQAAVPSTPIVSAPVTVEVKGN